MLRALFRISMIAVIVVAGTSSFSGQGAGTGVLTPVGATMPVADDADDPAIWIDPRTAADSVILGTNKVAAPGGALYVFGLDGAVRQIVGPLDRPNNVDVEYGLPTPAGPIDIAVVTERLQQRLRLYRIDDGRLTAIDGGGIRVLEGETGEAAMPMGVSLYRRPRDGAMFAIVAPKAGTGSRYLWQYRLDFDAATSTVRGTQVRRFGNYSGTGEIEAVAVDDALGYVYYSDESFALRKWAADPDHPQASQELAAFAREGFKVQREGIAIVAKPDGTGYIVCSDQIRGATELRVYRREGRPGRPHDHDPQLAVFATSADATDGIEITTADLGGRLAGGLLVMMNSAGKNFQLYPLGDLLESILRPATASARSTDQ